MVVRRAAAVVPVDGHVDLTTHDRLDASLLRLFVELDRAVHYAVVRERDARHVLRLRQGDEVPDPARPVEHRVLRMAVQVRESAAGRYRQTPSSHKSRAWAAPIRSYSAATVALFSLSIPDRGNYTKTGSSLSTP